MPVQGFPSRHSNQCSADSACGHCDGIIRHEPWWITQNASVQYAYRAVSGTGQLNPGDHLILHALGAAWSGQRILSKLRHSEDEGKKKYQGVEAIKAIEELSNNFASSGGQDAF
jgi:hypothetical protein